MGFINKSFYLTQEDREEEDFRFQEQDFLLAWERSMEEVSMDFNVLLDIDDFPFMDLMESEMESTVLHPMEKELDEGQSPNGDPLLSSVAALHSPSQDVVDQTDEHWAYLFGEKLSDAIKELSPPEADEIGGSPMQACESVDLQASATAVFSPTLPHLYAPAAAGRASLLEHLFSSSGRRDRKSSLTLRNCGEVEESFDLQQAEQAPKEQTKKRKRNDQVAAKETKRPKAYELAEMDPNNPKYKAARNSKITRDRQKNKIRDMEGKLEEKDAIIMKLTEENAELKKEMETLKRSSVFLEGQGITFFVANQCINKIRLSFLRSFRKLEIIMPAPTPLASSTLIGNYEFEGATGKEPWSSESFMIVPLQSQILLNESAEFLAAKTFLKMTRLPYKIKEMCNASSISPNGKIPVLRSGAYLVSELDGIVQHAQSKSSGLTDHLNSAQKADLRAFCSLVHYVLGTSLQYFTWIDDEVFKKSTKERIGSPYNFPLNVLLPWSLRRKMKGQLGSLKWAQLKVTEVYEKLSSCFSALSERLGETEYFFGTSPTELDALVFGYLFTMLTSHPQLPNLNDELSNLVKQYPNLIMFCRRIDDEFLTDSGVLDQ